MTVRVRTASGREQDERILRAVRLRCDGVSAGRIAALTGLSDAYVRASTNRVKDADTTESGEDVSAAYWDYSSVDADASFSWGRLPPRSVPLKADPAFLTISRRNVLPPTRATIRGPFSGDEISASILRSMAESAARECAAMAPFLCDDGDDLQADAAGRRSDQGR